MTFTIFDRLHTYCNDEMSAATYKYSVARPKMILISTSIQKMLRNNFEHVVNKTSRRKCKLPKIN